MSSESTGFWVMHLGQTKFLSHLIMIRYQCAKCAKANWGPRIGELTYMGAGQRRMCEIR